MNDWRVWSGVQGHAGSTGTDTNTIRAWRDKRFGQQRACLSHVLCLKEHFLLLQLFVFFALFSSLLLCAEGGKSYFYVHYHVYDHPSGVSLFLLHVR